LAAVSFMRRVFARGPIMIVPGVRNVNARGMVVPVAVML
jgi:hypothetical protein